MKTSRSAPDCAAEMAGIHRHATNATIVTRGIMPITLSCLKVFAGARGATILTHPSLQTGGGEEPAGASFLIRCRICRGRISEVVRIHRGCGTIRQSLVTAEERRAYAACRHPVWCV